MNIVKALVGLALPTLLGVLPVLPAYGADNTTKVFDEIRFGGSASIQSGRTHENGLFSEVTVFFDPFDAATARDWKERLARPRVNIGISVNTNRQASQLFAGFDWTTDITDRFYTEVGFGGVLHDGALIGNAFGPNLGCHLLFHEYVGAGYRFDEHWNATALVSHSSHAGLCGSRNDGMTRAGLQVGYKF